MTKDDDIFKGTTFSSLLKDVYDNSRKKDRQIKLLIAQLEPLVKNLNDASVVVPLIKEYLEVSVKNDDQLVKLASIVQKIVASEKKSEGQDGFLTEFEKNQLLRELEETKQDVERVDDLEFELDELKKSIK